MCGPIGIGEFVAIWNEAKSVTGLRYKLIEQYRLRMSVEQLRLYAIDIRKCGFHLKHLPRHSSLTKCAFLCCWQLSRSALEVCYLLRRTGCRISKKRVFRLAAKARTSGYRLRPLRWKCALNPAL